MKPTESPDAVPRTALSQGPCPSWTALACRYLREYDAKIRLAVAPLSEEEIWWRPAPGTNSIGNLHLHLAGNLSLWILAGVGGQTYERDRAGEFAARDAATKGELGATLSRVVGECCQVIGSLDAATLPRPLAIQTYETDILGAVFHAVEHMSYHTGQIVFAAKALASDRTRFEFYPRHRGE